MLKNEYIETCIKEGNGNKILNREYLLSIRCNYSELVIKDFMFAKENEYKEFRQECKNAGINTFVLTDQSTALMEELHGLNSAGMILNGVCEIYQWDKWEEKNIKIQGLRINIL